MSLGPSERIAQWGADIAVVVGSGLASVVDVATCGETIPYREIRELPALSVPGHAGEFVLGDINSTRVIFARGRVHLYEGHSAADVTAGIRFLHRAGIRQVILTNAAGSVNPRFATGSWMMITDHLNLTGTTALAGTANFLDMSNAYSAALRMRFSRAAQRLGMTLHEGVYAGLLGPQYETPAEVRMLRTLGADALGMSTVLETIQARALGIEVAGFSCLTNLAAGLSWEKLTHDEVLAEGKRAAEQFGRLLEAFFTGSADATL